MAESVPLLTPVGVRGLRQWGGMIDETITPALRGPRRRFQTYKQMRATEPYISGSLLALELIMRQVSVTVKPAIPGDTDAIAAATWLHGALFEDMTQTWSETFSEIISLMDAGWSTHELLYKVRRGANMDEGLDSRFTDGKYGWGGFDIRSQDTLLHWNFDEKTGRLLGFTQQPDTGGTYIIPAEKMLLFRLGQHKGNPEGVSLLHNCYKPWYDKQHIRAMQNIGIERNLAGYPLLTVPQEVSNPTTPEGVTAQHFWQDFITKIRVNEYMGAMIPSSRDVNGHLLYTLELLSAGGQRQFDLPAIIQPLNVEILVALFTDLLLLGHEKAGSWALSSSKESLLGYALSAILDSIYAVINRQAVKRLWRLNGFDPRVQPLVVPGEIESVDLGILGKFVTDMSTAGFDMLSHEAEILQRAGFSTLKEEAAA